jgi:hypothetical protein
MGSGSVIYVPSFIKIGSRIQKLIRGLDRHTQTTTWSHKPTLFFQNKESRQKKRIALKPEEKKWAHFGAGNQLVFVYWLHDGLAWWCCSLYNDEKMSSCPYAWLIKRHVMKAYGGLYPPLNVSGFCSFGMVGLVALSSDCELTARGMLAIQWLVSTYSF